MKLAVGLILGLCFSASLDAQGESLPPVKNIVPITTASLCLGFQNALKLSKQDFRSELEALCTANNNPTAILETLIAKPYEGNRPELLRIKVGTTAVRRDVQIFIAYSMRFPKAPVSVFLSDEPYIKSSLGYEEGRGRNGLKVFAKFLPPPINANDSDVAFQVQQTTSHAGDGVDFNDKSIHDLRLYRMYPNNYDFLLAVRTMTVPTNLFRKVVAVKTVMVDPNDQNKSYSMTVLNVIMDGNGENDREIDKFLKYVETDMTSAYAFINKQ